MSSPPRPKHKCPNEHCDVMLPYGRLACLKHWRRVSTSTQNRLMREWRKGITPAYFQAREDAIREMNL